MMTTIPFALVLLLLVAITVDKFLLDGMHPNDLEHALMAEAIISIITTNQHDE